MASVYFATIQWSWVRESPKAALKSTRTSEWMQIKWASKSVSCPQHCNPPHPSFASASDRGCLAFCSDSYETMGLGQYRAKQVFNK